MRRTKVRGRRRYLVDKPDSQILLIVLDDSATLKGTVRYNLENPRG